MQEYYIRNPDSEESRGPFTVEQLASLGETGHISLETYIYNPEIEQWEVLESNAQLREAVFPEKQRLTVRPKATFESLNKGEGDLAPITVNDLLLAAEGLTDETKHKKQEGVWREKAAGLAMYVSGAALALSGFALILLQKELLTEFDVMALVTSPLVLIALLDLGVALLLFLQTTAVYPLIRFRSMLGAGFFLLFFWAVGEPLLGIAAAAGALGVYGLTLFLSMTPFLISSALAILGMLGLLILAVGVSL